MSDNTLWCMTEADFNEKRLPSRFILHQHAIPDLMHDYCALNNRRSSDEQFTCAVMNLYARVLIDPLSLIERLV